MQFDKCYSELAELLTDHGFNRLEYFFITALELVNSVYFCNVLSTGQLPIQNSQLCTHNVLLQRASHFWGNVSFDQLSELFRLATLFQ